MHKKDGSLTKKMGEQELNALTCLNFTNMLKKDES